MYFIGNVRISDTVAKISAPKKPSIMRGLDMNDFCTFHMYLAICTIQSRMMVQLEYTYILWRTGAVAEFIFYTAFRTILLLLVPNSLIKRPDSKQKSYI